MKERKYAAIIIVGPSGSGKSSLVKKIRQDLRIKTFDMDDFGSRKDPGSKKQDSENPWLINTEIVKWIATHSTQSAFVGVANNWDEIYDLKFWTNKIILIPDPDINAQYAFRRNEEEGRRFVSLEELKEWSLNWQKVTNPKKGVRIRYTEYGAMQEKVINLLNAWGINRNTLEVHKEEPQIGDSRMFKNKKTGETVDFLVCEIGEEKSDCVKRHMDTDWEIDPAKTELDVDNRNRPILKVKP